jgi:hypothetical protein
LLPIGRVKTPPEIIGRRKGQERQVTIPVTGNHTGIEANQRPGNLKVTHTRNGTTRKNQIRLYGAVGRLQ